MAEFLRKRGDGFHHLALEVDDLEGIIKSMADNGINVPQWEINGDKAVRSEVLIGTRYAPTVLQLIKWEGEPAQTVEEWVLREKRFMRERMKVVGEAR